LAHTITAYRPSIEAALRYRVTNARVESTNRKLRLIIRRAFGFHSTVAHRPRQAHPAWALPAASRPLMIHTNNSSA